ncbi:hypothetical protein ACFV0R_09100 [Streptomyces sp. NPDC059578]|uniref:hypothetical protein n=1 Tax=Streptomyces sp. NPDC059578 TaxID=3346874 RepID=UPI003691E0E4
MAINNMHGADMRSMSTAKSLLASALGGVVILSGIGAQSAVAAPTPKPRVVAASLDGAEMRFFDLAQLIGQSCAPRVPHKALDSVASASVDPVPLNASESCAAQRHQLRITNAFKGTGLTTYAEMQAKLAGRHYPGARTHRMPDRFGKPVARVDLRLGAERLAVEISGFGQSVMVRAFGVPDGVHVTAVRLKPELDRPMS